MTRYVNTKTGAVLDSSFKVSGGDWIEEKDSQEKAVEEIPASAVIETQTEAPITEPQQSQPADIDKVTKDQIMQELDGFGVEYNPRDKKEVLYNLMMSQGA